ncbi:MAG: cytochrome [Leptolyngbyaceae cyanobacterium bins.59]|nr:cytochrome [Leptolyngbyaceae cyanobacterium bins.59]
MGKIIIGVMGPGEGATSLDTQLAYELGQLIAQTGWVLLTGGRNVGVMDAACRGARDAGGLTVGILPTDRPIAVSTAVDIPIYTDLGNGRNNLNVLSSQVVIACGMGTGTVSEVALALKNQKPVILLNWSEEGQRFFQSLSPDEIWVADRPETAIQLTHTLLSAPAT